MSNDILRNGFLNATNLEFEPLPIDEDSADPDPNPPKIRQTRLKKDFFKTNLVLREKYHVKLKQLAAKRGRYVWELLDEALEQYLSKK